MTPLEALANAARLLNNAELETNLALAEQQRDIAATWVELAGLLHEMSQDQDLA